MPDPSVGLPRIPELPSELVAAWSRAHADLATRLDAAGPDLALTFRRWTIAHLLVALAGRTPSVSGVAAPPLFPPARAFLSGHDRARIGATAAAFEHVDVRIALAIEGSDPVVLRPETPFVLHALAEGRETGHEVTNAGVVRTKVASWLAARSPYVHPPAELVRPLVELLVSRAAVDPSPPPALAGWAAFTWMSVHPWVDGNGRTARLLYLLLTGPHLPTGLDLGVVEQFTFHRRAYVASLQEGQHVTPVYDPEVLDAAPFTAAATRWSIAGAELGVRRVEAIIRADRELASARPDASDADRALALWVGLLDHAPASAFETRATLEGTERTHPVEALERLCEIRLAERAPLPPSRQPHEGGPPIGYRPGDPVLTAITRAVRHLGPV